jgi:phosphate transport system ATP-binding protein
MTTDSGTGGQVTDEATQQNDAPAVPAPERPVPPGEAEPTMPTVMNLADVSVFYGDFRAVRDVNMPVNENQITAMIGPSGCGKSTVLRSLNRMNDLIPTARVEGSITYLGVDLYGEQVDPVEVRRRIGMVFQKPNPFPKSIAENVTYGPRIAGVPKKDWPDLIEASLRSAAIWDEVKDRLDDSALGLSGGQQQRLCIARAIATKPDVLLMDEPCSALDPIATGRIEDLMQELKADYSIVIVTHNMQQAARVSDNTGFFTTELDSKSDRRTGQLVEFDKTDRIFSNPADERTENYVTGRFG